MVRFTRQSWAAEPGAASYTLTAAHSPADFEARNEEDSGAGQRAEPDRRAGRAIVVLMLERG